MTEGSAAMRWPIIAHHDKHKPGICKRVISRTFGTIIGGARGGRKFVAIPSRR